MMYYYGNDGWGLEHSLFGGIFMIFFWVAFALLIVWVIRGGRHGRFGRHRGCCGGHDMGGNRAIDILKERYAKGEINKEEFDTKKKDLEG